MKRNFLINLILFSFIVTLAGYPSAQITQYVLPRILPDNKKDLAFNYRLVMYIALFINGLISYVVISLLRMC